MGLDLNPHQPRLQASREAWVWHWRCGRDEPAAIGIEDWAEMSPNSTMVNLAVRIRIAVDTSAILPWACPSRCANGNARVSSDMPVWLESRAFRKGIYGM